jgi:Do/DeqQ family serine protease
MARRILLVAIVLSSAVTFLLGIAAGGWIAPAPVAAPPAVSRPAAVMPRGVDRPVVPVAIPGGVDFADVTARVNDSVVNIDTSVAEPEPDAVPRFRRRRPTPDDGGQEMPEPGSGSGFLIDPAGYLFTNHHVIDGAERITVTLSDGRVFRGEVAGADPAIDVALVKIDAGGPLPVAPLGDSSRLRPGEWVCAIGNPLGYEHSVTVGVISFIGRKLFDPSLDDYIQTDAAINFGNSGGPLINARGEVVGINAAVSSEGNSIGFAIPINQAVAVLPQLKARGRVSRGYIGVSLVEVTPDLQTSLKLPTTMGALVLDVSALSPAQRAGLRVYDLILSVDDQQIGSDDQLIREIARREPGSAVRLRLLRDGREREVQVKLAERPLDETAREGDVSPRDLNRPAGGQPSPRGRPSIGVSVRDLDETFIRRFAVPAHVRGVVVTRVDPAGAASGTDIRRGYLILEINRQPVRTVAEFERILAGARPGEPLALYVFNPVPGQPNLIAVTVDESR